MKIMEPTYQIIDPDNAMTPAQKIELVGRSCYKSEDKITDTSAVPFVKRLIQNKHEAMLEHAVIMFTSESADSGVELERLRKIGSMYEEYTGNPCFIRKDMAFSCGKKLPVFSGNVRAWRNLLAFAAHVGGVTVKFPVGITALWQDYPELFWDIPAAVEDANYGHLRLLSPTDLKTHHPYYQLAKHYPLTVRFTVDIAVARELCRHRLASHAGASTRYCDYANGKFGAETTVIMPSDPFNTDWVRSARYAEEKYLAQRNDGVPPEIARSALTLSTMAEHTMTATLAQWKHIFNLRALDKTGKAHPQMKQVMYPLYLECKSLFPKVFADMNE